MFNTFGIGWLILLMLIFMALFVFLFVFWIIMIIDCVKREFKGENDKVVWILVIVLLGFIGAAVYYFAVKVNDKQLKRK